MFQEYNDRLSELKAAQRQRINGLQREKELSGELKRRTHERDQWSEQLAREQKDVDRLNGISLGRLFYTLIGKKEEKLSQEEAELLQAKLQYEEVLDTVADLVLFPASEESSHISGTTIYIDGVESLL